MTTNFRAHCPMPRKQSIERSIASSQLRGIGVTVQSCVPAWGVSVTVCMCDTVFMHN